MLKELAPGLEVEIRSKDAKLIGRKGGISELAGNASVVRVLHAQRGSKPEEMPLAEFMARCGGYFASNGCIVDPECGSAADQTSSTAFPRNR
jgi:hypothetical protein